jgi:hypothetical protein
MTISLDQMIASVEREIRLRADAYPKFVQEHRMLQVKADHELAAMRAVLVTLKSIKENTNAVA